MRLGVDPDVADALHSLAYLVRRLPGRSARSPEGTREVHQGRPLAEGFDSEVARTEPRPGIDHGRLLVVDAADPYRPRRPEPTVAPAEQHADSDGQRDRSDEHPYARIHTGHKAVPSRRYSRRGRHVNSCAVQNATGATNARGRTASTASRRPASGTRVAAMARPHAASRAAAAPSAAATPRSSGPSSRTCA